MGHIVIEKGAKMTKGSVNKKWTGILSELAGKS